MKFILIPLILVVTVSMFVAFGDSNSPGFTNAISISNVGDNSTAPQLIVSGNNVYTAWVSNTEKGFDILFAKSSDAGASFEKPISLGNVSNGAADNVRMTESDGKIYAVWQSFLAGKSTIFFSKSLDGGSVFSSPIALSGSGNDSAFPQIAVAGSHLYTVWLERTEGDVTNVIFCKSDDDGNSFGKPAAITSHKGNSGLPKISADDNNVYLLWEDNSRGNFDIFLTKSSDAGSTFGAPVNISNNAGASGTPQMNVIGKTVYVVWMDDTPGNFDILLSKSTDGGLTFNKPVNVSGNQQESGYPQFSVYGKNVYVSWTNGVSDKNYDIFFAKSSDDGQSFADPINISNDPGSSGWPQLVVDGNVYVSWVDNTPGNFDIYIAKSIDDGKSFESPVNISNTPNESWYNRMAVSSSTVYMVWQEAEQKYHDIMFSKSTTFVPEFAGMVPIILVIAMLSFIIISKRSSLRINL